MTKREKLNGIAKEIENLLIEKYGTSEGAMAAWDTRGRGRKAPEKKEPKASSGNVGGSNKISTDMFQNKEAISRAESEGLMSVENEDLTPKGLVAKMKEWQESEGSVPEEIYDPILLQLRRAGIKMPSNIIRLERSADEDPDYENRSDKPKRKLKYQ